MTMHKVELFLLIQAPSLYKRKFVFNYRIENLNNFQEHTLIPIENNFG